MRVYIFDKYPELADQFELLCQTRRDEILSHLVETNSEYEELRRKKADTSMALKAALADSEDDLFEAYSDAVCEQEIYELDAVYRQALCDAFETLKNRGIL